MTAAVPRDRRLAGRARRVVMRWLPTVPAPPVTARACGDFSKAAALPRHARAARAIADESFEAGRVARALLKAVGLG